MPCADTVATVVLSDRQVALLVRSSVVPSDKVTRALNCDRAPASVKLEVPVTATLEMVGAAGATGVGAGATGVGAVGALLLLEHPVTNTATQTATENTVRPMALVEQEAFRRCFTPFSPAFGSAGNSRNRL